MDGQKVIKGLECCSDVGGKHCYEGRCPYASMSEPCREQLARDAIALIKELDEIIKRYAHFTGKITDPDVEEQPCPPMPTGGDVNGET